MTDISTLKANVETADWTLPSTHVDALRFLDNGLAYDHSTDFETYIVDTLRKAISSTEATSRGLDLKDIETGLGGLAWCTHRCRKVLGARIPDISPLSKLYIDRVMELAEELDFDNNTQSMVSLAEASVLISKAGFPPKGRELVNLLMANLDGLERTSQWVGKELLRVAQILSKAWDEGGKVATLAAEFPVAGHRRFETINTVLATGGTLSEEPKVWPTAPNR